MPWPARAPKASTRSHAGCFFCFRRRCAQRVLTARSKTRGGLRSGTAWWLHWWHSPWVADADPCLAAFVLRCAEAVREGVQLALVEGSRSREEAEGNEVTRTAAQVIAAIAIVLGLAALGIPFLGSMGACGPFVEHICDDLCPDQIQCTQLDRDNLSATCNALGFLVVYIGAFGWAACVLGIVAASLGCCVCCQCCKAKLDDGPKQGQPAVVVGAVQQAGTRCRGCGSRALAFETCVMGSCSGMMRHAEQFCCGDAEARQGMPRGHVQSGNISSCVSCWNCVRQVCMAIGRRSTRDKLNLRVRRV